MWSLTHPDDNGVLRGIAKGFSLNRCSSYATVATFDCHYICRQLYSLAAWFSLKEQAALWSGPHHDFAMQIANEQTVLGKFDNVEFSHFGVTSRFYKRDDRYGREQRFEHCERGRELLPDRVLQVRFIGSWTIAVD